jgi:hypothetical protein
MLSMQKQGYSILTFNGLGFDFDVLAEELCDMPAAFACANLALSHVDIMFDFFCRKGFPVGLNAASKGMGLAGKTEGMHGDLAPQMWRDGKFDEVLKYVGQDVKATLELAQTIDASSELTWLTKLGQHKTCKMPGGLLTVQEALALPMPDVSWMSDPWPREKFTGWTKAYLPDVPELAESAARELAG